MEKYKGKFLKIVDCGGWEVVQRINSGDTVSALAFTPEDEIILVEHYRVPLGKYVIESPAGLTDKKGESMVCAMDRELIEETGYTSDHWHILYENCPNSAGMTDEKGTKFLALDCVKIGEGGGVEDENIKVHLVHIDDIFKFRRKQIQEGKYFDEKIIAGLYLFEKGEFSLEWYKGL